MNRPNPFLNAVEHRAKANAKVIKIQREVNEVSQPYLLKKVQQTEKPIYVEELYKLAKKETTPLTEKEIEELMKNKQITRSNFISKILYDRMGQVNQGIQNQTEAQEMLFNRQIPALTAEHAIHALTGYKKENILQIHQGEFKPSMSTIEDLRTALLNPEYGQTLSQLMAPVMPINKLYPRSWSSSTKQAALLSDIKDNSNFSNAMKFAMEHEQDIIGIADRLINRQKWANDK